MMSHSSVSRGGSYIALHGPRQIRLLRVARFPGLPLSQFEFVTADIEQATPFEAVSYTWGNSNSGQWLHLADSRSVWITASLAEVLSHVARASATGLLWIDQVCINQEDALEKGQQVAMMADIFRQAERVIAWLGDEDEYTPILASLISAIGSEPSGPHICQRIEDKGPLDPIKRKLAPLIDAPARDTKRAEMAKKRQNAVSELLQRPWFTRAWIFQEYALAKSLVMLIGSSQFAPRDIDRLVTALFALQHRPNKHAELMVHATHGHQPFVKMVHSREASRQSQPEFLRFLSNKSGQFECSNPRDIVYAFLGFATPPELEITPDYTLTPDRVFVTTTRASIATRRCLDVLGLATRPPKGSSPPFQHLPSWVPDWTLEREIEADIWEKDDDNGFSASLGRPHLMEQGPDEKCLIVRGNIVDRLVYVDAGGVIFTDETLWDSLDIVMNGTNRWDNLKTWIALDIRLSCLKAAHLECENLPDPDLLIRPRLFRTLIAEGACIPTELLQKSSRPIPKVMDTARLARLLKVYDKNGYKGIEQRGGILSGLLPSAAEMELDVRILRRHSEVLSGRTVAITAAGRLALCPAKATAGDEVSILHGSGCPVVLRAQPDAAGGSRIVVGQCYLEDGMRGEMVGWDENGASRLLLR